MTSLSFLFPVRLEGLAFWEWNTQWHLIFMLTFDEVTCSIIRIILLLIFSAMRGQFIINLPYLPHRPLQILLLSLKNGIQLSSYISKELSYPSVFGPFSCNHFSWNCAILLLLFVPQHGSVEVHCVHNLSFPDGFLINLSSSSQCKLQTADRVQNADYRCRYKMQTADWVQNADWQKNFFLRLLRQKRVNIRFTYW